MEIVSTTHSHYFFLRSPGLAARMKMFHWSREDLSGDNVQVPEKYRKNGDRGNGGWTTKRSHDGLVRRLLHAMMTQDTFTVVSKLYPSTAKCYRESNSFCISLTSFCRRCIFCCPSSNKVGGHSAAQGQG